ncbi:protein kinase C-binding protein 1 isoform X2 [Anoplophora glabripennis]|uniref:protein kinase C-binding protein 1 isoform X2 n=1 Tax=Anoplophora glabripennis TaxID=217634 RepID=UPI000875128A|nr:protein kinase C-binding protein 1 isoform X2 [Anoplophora glabripennis]
MSDQRVSKVVDEAFNLESKSNSPVNINKDLIEDIIGTVSQPENSPESLDTKDNHVTTEKTNEVDNSEQTNSKKSRELKLLLALSKEANLDTNISHKRNSLEGNKIKAKDHCKTISSALDTELKRVPKVAHENRNFRYPVTAESELELDISDNDKKYLTDNSNKASKRKRDDLNEVSIGGATEEFGKKNKKSLSSDMAKFKQNKDVFCWRCHREAVNIACETCPRSYHQKCLKQTINDTEHWPCPECVSILKAESTQTRSTAMKGMTLEHLCSLLKFAVNRMIQCQGSEPFLHPVNDSEFPDYKNYIVQPMDLTKMEKNIKGNLYGSTQAFEADAKWLLHNSIIYNSYQSKLTSAAKSIIKICKQEMAEIENCPSCYLNANTKKNTWFVEVCPKPHLLVWAKLKGFPFWPAKAMCTNTSGMVDVRFFGAHDRAWVHYKECYLFSEKDPNTFKQKRYDIEKCIDELNIYIENLKKIYGEFKYAPYKTLLEPDNETKQLQIFLPKYKTPSRKKNKIDNINSKVNFIEDKKEKKVIADNTSEVGNDKTNSPEENKKDDENKTQSVTQQQNNIEMEKTVSDVKNNDPDINQNGTDMNVNGSDASYSVSKFDDDAIMEGYGTDDDTNTEIDLERRKNFIGKTTEKAKETIEEITQEEEEEDDTQVPSNISVDSSNIKESERKQECVPDNEPLARRISDAIYNQKRQSTEDVIQSSQKIARRNSDLSVKSDSALMPSISEKINRVDISENMEITLGNDDIGCISISENISSNSSDSELSRSEIEQSKRKPVQVDIENAEFTISPTNKLKISDKLIKRLSDSDKNADSKIEEARRNINDKKSPTDILIEKFRHVVDHEIVDFSQPSTSSVEDSDKSCNSNSECLDPSTKTCDLREISVGDNTTETAPSPITNEDILVQSNCDNITQNKDEADHEPKIISITDNIIDIAAKKYDLAEKIDETPLDPKQDDIEKEYSKIEINVESKKSDNFNGELVVSPKDNEASELQPSEELPRKQRALIQPSITEFTISSTNTPALNGKSNSSGTEDNANANFSVTDKPTPQNEKMIHPEVLNIIEEFEDSEEVEELEDIEIDKNNIFNIIHSSLNEAKSIEADKQGRTYSNENNTLLNSKMLSRKRKVISNENSTQAKLVKLVPIETILNKSKEKEISNSPLLQKSLQGKKMIRKPSSSSSTPMSSVSRQSSVQEILTEDIKSEPETDDDFSESENLEAKRKYLSALNISEKINDPNKKQGNAIRTRSKTEEKREKFKKLDNLTRIIDDVAMNFSASSDRLELGTQNLDVRQSVSNSLEGEIFVKSFAKMTPYKPRARKSFPTPTYIKPNVQPKLSSQVSLLKKDTFPNNAAPKKDFPKTNTTATKAVISNSVTTTTQSQQTTEIGSSSVSHVIILPPNQTINYSSPMLTVVSPVVCTTAANSSPPPLTHTLHKTIPVAPNVVASQNYIPQSEERGDNSVNTNADANNTLIQPVTATRESNQRPDTENNTNPTVEPAQDDEFTVLNGLLPETVSRAVSDLLLRAPPKLKPRPPGPLSTIFDEGIPSSAGNVTAKINAVAYRLGDYFRGMLIETLEDLGKSATPEAKITSLQMEIEALKHRHSVEMAEIRKNVCTILKDIQKSIIEDRERIIDETRAACEAETIKRVELSKSKQWCANCSKEAQFYCCWNTSYCDYPCQQKHWPQHVGKCTQNIEKGNNISAPPNRPSGQQLILRPAAPPKPGMGRIVAKPTKVYMNRNAGTPKTFKTLTTTGNHLTVIETTPGNYELVGNGPITVSGKLLATSSGIFHPKFKTANVVTVASPSSSGNTDQRNIQRINTSSEPTNPATSTASSSVTTVVDDDSD